MNQGALALYLFEALHAPARTVVGTLAGGALAGYVAGVIASLVRRPAVA